MTPAELDAIRIAEIREMSENKWSGLWSNEDMKRVLAALAQAEAERDALNKLNDESVTEFCDKVTALDSKLKVAVEALERIAEERSSVVSNSTGIQYDVGPTLGADIARVALAAIQGGQ